MADVYISRVSDKSIYGDEIQVNVEITNTSNNAVNNIFIQIVKDGRVLETDGGFFNIRVPPNSSVVRTLDSNLDFTWDHNTVRDGYNVYLYADEGLLPSLLDSFHKVPGQDGRRLKHDEFNEQPLLDFQNQEHEENIPHDSTINPPNNLPFQEIIIPVIIFIGVYLALRRRD